MSDASIVSNYRRSDPIWLRLSLCILFCLTTRVFQFFPGMRRFEEMWFVVCCLGFLVAYPALKNATDWRLSHFEIYLLVLTALEPSLEAWASYVSFGQPLVYGLLAQRRVVLLLIWILFFNCLRLGVVKLSTVESVLLSISWCELIGYSAARLFLHPESYIAAGPGFVNGGGEAGYSFVFNNQFLVFGVAYYAMRAFRARRMRDYVAALAMFVMSLGASGRALSLSIVLALLTILAFQYSMERYILTVAKCLCAGLILIAALYLAQPHFIEGKFEKYSEALTVATRLENVQDASANARVDEVAIAWPLFKKHPLIGNGFLSAQWHGGASGVLGTNYFYEDDIGIVGILYSAGIFGLILHLFQYWFAWRARKSLNRETDNSLLDAIQVCTLISLLSSTTTGEFVWISEQTLFYVGMMVTIAGLRHRSRAIVKSTSLPNGFDDEMPLQIA
jgi:hypothetical protein